MTENRHPNSHRITIFRCGSFMEQAQTGAMEFMSMSKKSIGTYFSSNLGNAIGTGLEFEEIDVLMPLVIDIPHKDSTFRIKVKEFFSNIVTNVPFGSGRELEIGLKLGNDKPICVVQKDGTYTEINVPINITDYIRYRHALKHPMTAATRAEAKGNMLKEFYIFDKATEDMQQASSRKIGDKALATYLAIKTDADKVDAMLTLLGTDIRMYHGPNAEDGKLEKLHEYVTTDADLFNKIYEEKDFDLRFLVRKMINTGVVRPIGSQFTDKETGSILGHSIEEVIYYLKDAQNSDQTSILKAKTQEAMKNKLTAPKNKNAKTTVRA